MEMLTTVHANDPDGRRVILRRGTEAPDWYQGPNPRRSYAERSATAPIPHPAEVKPGDETVEQVVAEVEPGEATVEQVVDRVGTDPAAATAALEAETALDKPRVTLIAKLQAVIDDAAEE